MVTSQVCGPKFNPEGKKKKSTCLKSRRKVVQGGRFLRGIEILKAVTE
jgi:hypothetical protein